MEAKSKKRDQVVEVVLLAIIVLLLIHNCSLVNKKGKDTNNEPVPGNKQILPNGNETVIELLCDKNDDNCKPIEDNNNNNKNNNKKNNNVNKDEKNNNNNNDNSNDNNTDNQNNDTTDDEDEVLSNEVEVFDRDKDSNTWNGSADLNIFKNSMYTKEGTIAPESTNTYKLTVKNGTSTAVKYSINFTETNSSNINMKYKLKKNDQYIISDYVSSADLNLNNLELASGSNDVYLIEWKWISSSNDTEIGKNGATYGLQINVEAESI